jgi:hypothetical protein
MTNKGQLARQTILNTRALLEARGCDTTFLDLVTAQQDRAIWRDCGSNVARRLDADPETWARWDMVGNHGLTAQRGWREMTINWPCQVIAHEGGLLEIDFDRMSPERGLAPAIVHGCEVMWHRLTGRKTSAIDVARGLRQRGIKVPHAS